MKERYEALANAIILQAVKDYRKAYKCYRRNPKNRTAREEIAVLVRFFTGNWYKTLTDVDGVWLVENMNAKYDKEIEANAVRSA